jgi:hypothetical protein
MPFCKACETTVMSKDANSTSRNRFADGYIERLPALADELVRLNPNVILSAERSLTFTQSISRESASDCCS